MARFKRFVAGKYGEGMTLEWIKSDDAPGGFRLEAGSDVYDWSAEGRVAQLRRKLERIALGGEKVIPLIKETLDAWQPEALAEETGRVISVGDGIVAAEGLDNAEYGVAGSTIGIKSAATMLSGNTMGVAQNKVIANVTMQDNASINASAGGNMDIVGNLALSGTSNFNIDSARIVVGASGGSNIITSGSAVGDLISKKGSGTLAFNAANTDYKGKVNRYNDSARRRQGGFQRHGRNPGFRHSCAQ